MSRRPRILHLIQCLSRGGASRALLDGASAAAELGSDHRILSLRPTAGPLAAAARDAGLTVLEQPERARLHHELERADVVQVHFWNTPELYAVLTGPLPPLRLALWCHTGGGEAPHVLTSALAGFADAVVASAPVTTRLPAFAHAGGTLIRAAEHWRRLETPGRRAPGRAAHPEFRVGYIGTVDFEKLHPEYVAMSAAVAVPAARFVVCGAGDGFRTLARQAQALGARERFELAGYVEDVAAVLAGLDVFGYPLAEGNYSASELALIEAMYAGVPPVVLAHGGAAESVLHGQTGLVVEDPPAYTQALEYLYDHPQERRRLARGARRHAAATWDLGASAAAWDRLYAGLLERPKRARTWPGAAAAEESAAVCFVESLGGRVPAFARALTGDDPVAEAAIATASPALASASSGGVLHWRRAFARDPTLRLWSGLVLGGGGRPALAAGEFKAAHDLGSRHPRLREYLDTAIAAAGGGAHARMAGDG